MSWKKWRGLCNESFAIIETAPAAAPVEITRIVCRLTLDVRDSKLVIHVVPIDQMNNGTSEATYNFDIIAITAGTSKTMFVAIPLVLTLMAEDNLAICLRRDGLRRRS